MYRWIIRPILFRFEPEQAHALAMWSMSKSFWWFWRIYGFIIRHYYHYDYLIRRGIRNAKWRRNKKADGKG